MVTLWLLVYFLHDFQGTGADEQITLASFESQRDCEKLLATATSPEDLRCIGIDVNPAKVPETPRTRFYQNKQPNYYDFKMRHWM